MKRNEILTIMRFMDKYCGKTVRFKDLPADEQYAFVLTDQYNFHSKIVSSKEAIDRAVRNANSHKKNGYEIYSNKSLKITK